MKEVKKTNNILIREGSRKANREVQGPKSRTSIAVQDKKRTSKDERIEFQKQLTKGEYLSEEEQKAIAKQASKMIGKKVRSSENKIEGDMVSFLESECAKLGFELEKQKNMNQRQRSEIETLRKNIAFLNEKLEKIYSDHDSLAKNNNYGQMEKEQLREELQKLRSTLKRKEDENDYNLRKNTDKIESLIHEVEEKNKIIENYRLENEKLKFSNEELQEYLDDKTMEAQYLRENFEERKKEWDRIRLHLENQNKQNIEKKGEKILKFQGDVQTLQEKLKEEQVIRKKLTDKNKQFDRQLVKKNEMIKELEQTIGAMKKRINDLSILKSSNNTIMNQKMVKLSEENQKLQEEIEVLKGKKNCVKQYEKPMLFGASDFD